MRIFLLDRQTVELVQRAEQCRVSWITVHGRTPKQRAEPANMEAIKLVCKLLILIYQYLPCSRKLSREKTFADW